MERKMALVRSLQSAYYKASDTSTAAASSLEMSTGILRNLPLWREFNGLSFPVVLMY